MYLFTNEKKRLFNLLASPLFLVSLGLLAINDFILKSALHNWLTGKLSDIAGLIAFTLFSCAIWPCRRWLVAAAISACFLFWKSPHVQPMIDFLNSLLPFTIGRTTDYTDLLALPAVWVATLLIFRVRAWPIRDWGVGIIGTVSVVFFMATTYLPMQQITRTAVLPANSDQRLVFMIEAQLKAVFDRIADDYGLQLAIDDPLSLGRLYVKNKGRHSDFALVVNFDFDRRLVFFDISSRGPEAKNNAPEIKLLRNAIENKLQTLFPGVKIAAGKLPRRSTIQLGVRKKNAQTAYQSPENQEDFRKAISVIDTIVSRHGLQRSTSGRRVVFYAGQLFGPLPRDHDLVVDVDIADWPLVAIDITSSSIQYSELQHTIAGELERALQTEFGKRAWVR
jgi:hypothetical protein